MIDPMKYTKLKKKAKDALTVAETRDETVKAMNDYSMASQLHIAFLEGTLLGKVGS